MIIAPLPLLPIYKGFTGASLLAEILLGKYVYHLPFYRQVQQFQHLGVKIQGNTISGWFKPACELLKPLYEVVKKEDIDTDYLQVDNHPAGDQQRKSQGKKRILVDGESGHEETGFLLLQQWFQVLGNRGSLTEILYRLPAK